MNAFAIVDAKGSIVITVANYPIGSLQRQAVNQLAIYPDQASADGQMVEWADEGLDVTGYKVVQVAVSVTP